MKVGDKLTIWTVRDAYTGQVTEIAPKYIVLRYAARIPQGRLSEYVAGRALEECEPFPDDQLVGVWREAIVAWAPRDVLPRKLI